MRALLLSIFACAIARADAPIAAQPASLPSLTMHPLAPRSWRGGSTFLARGGSFVSVRETRSDDEGWVQHGLAIATERGWFIDDLGETLLDDTRRDRAFAGPMRASVDRGVLLVRVGRAIWKRDYAELLARDRDALPTYSCDELLIACVANDGAPSCSDPILVADESACDEADTGGGGDFSSRAWDWRLAASVRAPDRIALRVLHGHPRKHAANDFAIVVGEARLATESSRGTAAGP